MLAAGLSRRWGADNKLLAQVAGKPMIRRTVETVLESSLRPVIVVTGHQTMQIKATLKSLPVEFRRAKDFAQGMAASLRTGVAAAPADCDGVLVCLADMPFVEPQTLDRIASAYDPTLGWVALLPTYDGKRGNPVLLGRPLFQEIMRLSGDQGARALFQAIPERVLEIAVDDPGVLRDIDLPEALPTAPEA